jgi:hypothetical protein
MTTNFVVCDFMSKERKEMPLSLCESCGAVVIDRAAHHAFHERVDQVRIEPSTDPKSWTS